MPKRSFGKRLTKSASDVVGALVSIPVDAVKYAFNKKNKKSKKYR